MQGFSFDLGGDRQNRLVGTKLSRPGRLNEGAQNFAADRLDEEAVQIGAFFLMKPAGSVPIGQGNDGYPILGVALAKLG